MNSLHQAQRMIIFSLVLLTYQHPDIGKYGINDIPQTKAACLAQKERIQFFEFRPEHSAEEYELPPQIRDDLKYEQSFCTRSKMAVITVLQNKITKQELSIEIVDGFLSLSVEEFEDGKPRCIWTFSDEPVNNGILHTVKVKISPKLLSIELYKMYKLIWSESSLKYNSCLTNETLSTLHRLVLGGRIIDRDPNSKIQVLYGFVGCMKNIRVDGHSIQKVGKLLISEDVTPGCPEFDECCTEICPPTAKHENGFCVCPEGTQMNADDTCSPSCSCIQCQNGGICYTSSTEAHCACPSGFSGDRCEVILSPCDGVLCNNGSCIIDHNSTSFKCICDKGHKGKFCNEKDKCFNNPCRNGGTCQEIPDDFICLCPPGISGNVCDERLSTSEDKGNTTVLYASIGVVLLIFFVISVYIIWKWKSEKCPSCCTTKEGTNPNDTGNSDRIPHNNPSTEIASFEENETGVTCRTEQPAHLDDSAGNIVTNNDSAVPVVNYSKNENHIGWFTDKEEPEEAHNMKTNEGNSDKEQAEEGHNMKTDEGSSDKEEAEESHNMKADEGKSDKEAEESDNMKTDQGSSDKEEAEEGHNMKTDEESSDKEAEESHNMKTDEGKSNKEAEESHNMKTDQGRSDKEEAEGSHTMNSDEGRSDEEEADFEGNNTDITGLNEPEREKKNECREYPEPQCQQNASDVSTETKEIFV